MYFSTRTAALMLTSCFVFALAGCARVEDSSATAAEAAPQTASDAGESDGGSPAVSAADAGEAAIENEQAGSSSSAVDETNQNSAAEPTQLAQVDALADEAEEQADDEAEPGLYDVPQGDDVDQLSKFIRKIYEFEPSTTTEFIEHRRQAGKAILAAANRILELEKDETSDAYQFAKQQVLSAKTQGVGDMSAEEQQALVDEVFAFLKGKDVSAEDLQIAYPLAQRLEYSDAADLAASVYEQLAARLASSDDSRLVEFGERMAGSARRLKLLGEEMEFTGTTVTGEAFDLESLRGSKAILVDYWATWCGPCVAEYPNMKEMYDKYHDKGFEIVGISGDQQRADLEEYIDAKKVPWVNLFHEGEGSSEAMTKYGISAFPTMILIGPEFKVVSLNARGPRLQELLGGIFGEPAEDATEAGAGEEPAPTDAPAE